MISAGGALIGLLLGALAGAALFYLSGSMDLIRGFINLLVFSLVGAVVGSQVGRMITLRRPVIEVPSLIEDPDALKRQLVDLPEVENGSVSIDRQIFSLDLTRLILLIGIFS